MLENEEETKDVSPASSYQDSWKKTDREINKSLISFLPFVFQFPSFSIASPTPGCYFVKRAAIERRKWKKETTFFIFTMETSLIKI